MKGLNPILRTGRIAMLKVLEVFPIGAMLSITLDGACDGLHNGSKLIDQNGHEITVESVAMIQNDNPKDFAKSTTILVKRCDIEKGDELKEYFIDDRVIIPEEIKKMSREQIKAEIAKFEAEAAEKKKEIERKKAS